MLSDPAKILQDECQFDHEQPILVGVSGGADSLCVLDLLDQNGYPVVVAHFDHKLRPESSAEADIVRNFAQSRGFQFILDDGDVQARAEQEQESLEEAARKARYRFLFQCAEDLNAQAVVVGHSADDQVETVLMHLLRGSGMSGLSGMSYRWLPNAWHDEIPLVRPLLGVWRAEILAYCHKRGLSPISDASNEEATYFRNHLRLDLIPFLETFNPAVRKLIWQTAEVTRGDRDLIVNLVDAAWSDSLVATGVDFVALDTSLSKQYPVGMQRHLIRRAIAQLRPEMRDISFEAVERGVNYIQDSRPSAEIDLISGLKLVSEPGKLWIAEWEAELPSAEWPQVIGDQSFLEVGGTVDLQSGWQLSAHKVANNEIPFHVPKVKVNVNQVWLDLEQIELPLLVRARKEGDRLQPFGMGGHSQKISDFMINEKIPRRARKRWPLVCSADKIVWVPGYRPAQSFLVTGNTTEVVKLSLRFADVETEQSAG